MHSDSALGFPDASHASPKDIRIAPWLVEEGELEEEDHAEQEQGSRAEIQSSGTDERLQAETKDKGG